MSASPPHRPAPAGPLSVEDARARMLEGVAPLGAEPVRLGPGLIGRVLAQAVAAGRDQPPFDASAMDGYAVLPSPDGATLSVVGESVAGRRWPQPLQPGQAVRIFTGAPVPAGAVVVPQEDTVREGDRVSFGPREGAGGHVRRRGADFAAGAVLLAAGLRLDPWRLSLVASAGLSEVAVATRPRVAILSTGEEIVAPGAAIGPDEIYESGSVALCTRAAGWGGKAMMLDAVGDDEAAIAEAALSVDCDLLVTVGGASVGDHDLVKPALARLGLEIVVPSVKMRPGKPTWFGRLPGRSGGDGRRVLGLPGNPASALVAAELFLRPLLAVWQGADPALPMRFARLAEPMPAAGPREHWMRARLTHGPDGATHAVAFPDQDSSLVSVLALADALLRRPAASPAAPAGAVVEVLPLDRL